MERYKKRTISLCLASILTVVGAFGAENYSNSLMALKINNDTDGIVSVTAFTETPYNNSLNSKQIDNNTYVITMPDTQSNADVPDLSGFNNIESIDISTFPYTKESNGYTTITIKTLGNTVLSATPALFIPDKSSPSPKELTQKNNTDSYWDSHYSKNSSTKDEEGYEEEYEEKGAVEETPELNNNDAIQNYTPPDFSDTQSSSDSFEYITVLLCMSILFLIIGFIYLLGRDKMRAVVGDSSDFELDSEDDTQKKSKSIRTTIKKLDKKYTVQNNTQPVEYNYSSEEIEKQEQGKQKEPEQVVVDLDMLYQEKTIQTNEENNNADDQEDDLAGFLNEFTFGSEDNIPDEEVFDEELYNRVINNKQIRFTKSDMQRINKLLQNEIGGQAVDDIRKRCAEEHPKKLSQKEILEDLLSTYSIKQNINFTKEDVDALKKLMSVELDEDFVKNLHTNPKRIKIVEKEILESNEKQSHKNSEAATLQVKDLLPDLSKELKKQGNKKIVSEVKSQVVYYSEGYEVKKLSVSKDLSDISNALKRKDASDYKPSCKAPIVETGYEFSTLYIKDELPDLADVIAHPDKYEEKEKKKEKIDENTLLKSLANVTFKPFYEEPENIQTGQKNDLHLTENNILTQSNNIKTEFLKTEKVNDDAQKLLKLIEEKQAERELKKMAKEDAEEFKKELEKASKNEEKENKQNELINFNGEDTQVIKSIKCTQNSSCLLVKSDAEYYIIGKINDKQFELKKYDSVSSTNMQIRLNDKNNKEQYLVKIGSHKIVIKVTEEKMEFVMDLC